LQTHFFYGFGNDFLPRIIHKLLEDANYCLISQRIAEKAP
jgi:hypothetical protein